MTEENKPARPRRSSYDLLAFNGRGRPMQISSSVAVKYVALLAAGNYREPSAMACGLAPATVAMWHKRGEALLRRGDLPVWPGASMVNRPRLDTFCRVLVCIAAPLQDPELWLAGFAAACIEAEGGSEVTLVLGLRKAAQERPDVAFKLLERRYPSRWGAPKPSVSAQVTASPEGASASFVVYAPEEREP